MEFSRPGKPTDNAFVESFNGHFRAECLDQHWFETLAEAREVIEAWRVDYNEERPHQALQDRTPAELYTCSSRSYPARAPKPEYPAHFEVRRVRTDGSIKWRGGLLFITMTLCSELVGLEEVADGLWSVWFMVHLLGRIDLRNNRITYVPV